MAHENEHFLSNMGTQPIRITEGVTQKEGKIKKKKTFFSIETARVADRSKL